ncbi:MAG: hypothetical protein ACI8TX_003685 [Hyphomicrobiaceae bacterium]|jgi:hypothetical protein
MSAKLVLRTFSAALCLVWISAGPAVATESLPSKGALAAGDALWAKRAEALSGKLAAPEAIESAIESYQTTQSDSPNELETRWKLLRALHYSVDFADRDDDAKEANVDQAVALAHDSMELLERGTGDDHNRARVYFWSGIAWGIKASRVGLLTIVRDGLATKMHDTAQKTAELDPSVDQGGALRLLSRLHATIPRVPFISGWVDRGKSLGFAERALALDPSHPGTELIMALALLEREPNRKAEARTFLERVASLTPRDDHRVEDLACAIRPASSRTVDERKNCMEFS